jgi:hypothetical protein
MRGRMELMGLYVPAAAEWLPDLRAELLGDVLNVDDGHRKLTECDKSMGELSDDQGRTLSATQRPCNADAYASP